MNRTLMLGIAVFFAVIGISLLGSQSQAVAGHGCHGSGGYGWNGGGWCGGGGCHGGVVYDSGHGCHGSYGCHGDCGGRRGLLHRLHQRRGHRLARFRHGCDGGCWGGGCHGGYVNVGYGCHGGGGCHGY